MGRVAQSGGFREIADQVASGGRAGGGTGRLIASSVPAFKGQIQRRSAACERNHFKSLYISPPRWRY